MTNSILAKTTIALATVLMLGGATAALANDIDESASGAQVEREARQAANPKAATHLNSGRAAYGFVPSVAPQANNNHYSDRVDDNR